MRSWTSSTRTPPAATSTSGPNVGSRTMPSATSTPGVAIAATIIVRPEPAGDVVVGLAKPHRHRRARAGRHRLSDLCEHRRGPRSSARPGTRSRRRRRPPRRRSRRHRRHDRRRRSRRGARAPPVPRGLRRPPAVRANAAVVARREPDRTRSPIAGRRVSRRRAGASARVSRTGFPRAPGCPHAGASPTSSRAIAAGRFDITQNGFVVAS